MSTSPRTVVVVGGGVVGTACAYFLAKAGWGVTVVERGKAGRGSSSGNCGYICPSHVLPLAEPGAVAKSLKTIFRKDSPLTIRPRLDPALWSWLLNFARRCNTRDMMEAGRGIQAILDSSMALYREVIEREALDCEFQTRGLLYAYRSKAAMDGFAETNRLLTETFQTPAVRFDGDEVMELEPALKPGLAGGWLYEEDAHVRPDKLLTSWRRVLEARGVAYREDCEVRGFAEGPGGAKAVVTTGGEFPAAAFVVATGAWTPLLNRALGAKIPIQPGKGYSLTMPRPAACPVIPMIFPESRVAVTPFASGYRLGSTMEFAGYDSTIHPARLQLLKDGAAPFLREPTAEPIEEEWFGWRPMTYDGLPIIDRSPRFANVLIAAGHNMIGLSTAPATGQLAAEILGEGRPHLDPAPYRVGRFA